MWKIIKDSAHISTSMNFKLKFFILLFILLQLQPQLSAVDLFYSKLFSQILLEIILISFLFFVFLENGCLCKSRIFDKVNLFFQFDTNKIFHKCYIYWFILEILTFSWKLYFSVGILRSVLLNQNQLFYFSIIKFKSEFRIPL